MTNMKYAARDLVDVTSAHEHFSAHHCNIDLYPGVCRKLDYSTQVCFLGESFVSSSASVSGWGYKTRSELDSFIFTVPGSGEIIWKNKKERFNSSLGRIFLADQREIQISNYSSNVSYESFYVSVSDMNRYLAILLGEIPKSNIYFTKRTVDGWGVHFFTNTIRSILLCASNTSPEERRPIRHLKESLMSFLLFNVDNNYSHELKAPAKLACPMPYSIKRAADYISLNYDQNLTVSELAIHAGISIRALQLGFKHFKQTTPINYLRDVRLNAARTMLLDRSSGLTPKEIALKCGFSNYYLFCKYYYLAYFEHPSFTRR